MSDVTSSPRRLDPELILAESAWMRALARRLVGDPDAAEDVVQDVWIAAWRRGPRLGGAAGTRAWLARVARNLSLRRRRGEERRTNRERAAARAEAVAGPGDELDRLAVLRRVADEVLRLEEPERTALVLRYQEGLSTAEVARRQGTTPAAARQRLSRGVRRLRERLDAGHGGRAGWCVGALAWVRDGAGPAGPAVPAATIGGAGLMGTKTLAGGVAVVALATIAGVGWLGSDLESTPLDAAPLEASVPAARDGAAPTEAPASPRATETPRAEPGGGPRQAVVRPGAAQPPTVTVRVVDARGAPVPGPVVRVGEGTARTGGEDGLVVLPVTAGATQVHATAEGFVGATLELGPEPGLSCVLARLPRVEGRLRDRDGRRLERTAEVLVDVRAAGAGEAERLTTTVAPGEDFVFAGLPVGSLERVVVRTFGFVQHVDDAPKALEPDGEVQADQTLDPGVIVEGTVLDSATSEPVPGARVWCGGHSFDAGSWYPHAVADDLGRFRLIGVEPDEHVMGEDLVHVFQLLAESDRHAASRARAYASTPSDDGRYSFEVRIDPALARLHGRVVDAAGPVEGAIVFAIDERSNSHFAGSGPDGSFSFEGLPEGELGLWARRGELADGEQHDAGGAVVEIVSGAPNEVVVRLGLERARLEGIVLDAAGRPVADCPVAIASVFRSASLALSMDETLARTDAEGRFAAQLPPGRYDVQPQPEGPEHACGEPHSRQVVVGPGEALRDLEFGRSGCQRIAGRVAADAPELTEIVVRRPGAEEPERTKRPGTDGAFELERLSDGIWELELRRGEAVLDRMTVGPGDATGLVLGDSER